MIIAILVLASLFAVVLMVVGVAFGLQARRDKKEFEEWFKRNGYGKEKNIG